MLQKTRILQTRIFECNNDIHLQKWRLGLATILLPLFNEVCIAGEEPYSGTTRILDCGCFTRKSHFVTFLCSFLSPSLIISITFKTPLPTKYFVKLFRIKFSDKKQGVARSRLLGLLCGTNGDYSQSTLDVTEKTIEFWQPEIICITSAPMFASWHSPFDPTHHSTEVWQ